VISPLAQLAGGDRADAPELLDGEWMQEGQLVIRRHHE